MKYFFKLLIFALTASLQTTQTNGSVLSDILIACKVYQLRAQCFIEGVKLGYYEEGYKLGPDPLKYAELFAESYARAQLITIHGAMMDMDHKSPLVPVFIKNAILSLILKDHGYPTQAQKTAELYHTCLIENNVHGTRLGSRKVPSDCQSLQNEFLKAAYQLGTRELHKQ